MDGSVLGVVLVFWKCISQVCSSLVDVLTSLGDIFVDSGAVLCLVRGIVFWRR